MRIYVAKRTTINAIRQKLPQQHRFRTLRSDAGCTRGEYPPSGLPPTAQTTHGNEAMHRQTVVSENPTPYTLKSSHILMQANHAR